MAVGAWEYENADFCQILNIEVASKKALRLNEVKVKAQEYQSIGKGENYIDL